MPTPCDLSEPSSVTGPPAVPCSFSYPSGPSWLPDPFFRIFVKNVHRCKHGSDSGGHPARDPAVVCFQGCCCSTCCAPQRACSRGW
jgi:hypothetical protein